MITLINKNGKAWHPRVEVATDIAILAISTDPSNGEQYFARYNHEIMVEVTEEIFRALEQHIQVSDYVAQQRLNGELDS